jgi:RNA polymerase subunit RPABC4/transcription elongation factor Spt4
MAVKKCKYCAMEIPNEARICPYCRKKLPRYIPGWVSLVVIVLVLYSCTKMFNNPPDTVSYDEAQAQADCENFVKARLKSPSTAKFPAGPEITISGSGTGPWKIYGYVDSQNSYGAMLRQKYECVLHYEGTTVKLDKLDFH